MPIPIFRRILTPGYCYPLDMVFAECQRYSSTSHFYFLLLSQESSEIKKSPAPGIERELDWLLRTTPSAERPRLWGHPYITRLCKFVSNEDFYLLCDSVRLSYIRFRSRDIGGCVKQLLQPRPQRAIKPSVAEQKTNQLHTLSPAGPNVRDAHLVLSVPTLCHVM